MVSVLMLVICLTTNLIFVMLVIFKLLLLLLLEPLLRELTLCALMFPELLRLRMLALLLHRLGAFLQVLTLPYLLNHALLLPQKGLVVLHLVLLCLGYGTFLL